MLDVFRGMSQSWVAKIVMLLIALSFVLWGVSGYLFDQSDSSQIVAKVDGEKISSSLFQHRLQQATEQYTHIFGAATAEKIAKTPAFTKQVLDSMIDDLLLAHEARKLHLQVPDSALRAKIVSMPVFAVKGQFSRARYEQLLKDNGLTPAQFEAQLRQGMLLEQLQSLPQILATASPTEAQQVWQWSQEYRNVYVLTLQNQDVAGQVQQPSAAEIKKYYEAHQQQFQQAAQVQVAYVVFGEQNVAAGSTAATGSNSAALQFESQIDDFKNALFSSNDLQAVAAKYHLTVQKSALMQEGTPGTGVFSDPKALALAFSSAVLAGKNSSALRLTNGDLLAVHLLHYQPARARSLAQVEDQVRAQLVAQQAVLLREKTAKQLLAAVQKRQNIQALQEKYASQLMHFPELSRRADSGLPAALLQKIFLEPAPALGKLTAGVASSDNASTLYVVAGVVLPSPSLLNPSVRDEIQKSLAEQRVRLLSQGYLKALRDHAKVKIYQKNVEQVSG
ncbi:MAG: SurA N-terminal domain-containing protein [Candidatus Igneacidithiobacillus chanchocoensis]